MAAWFFPPKSKKRTTILVIGLPRSGTIVIGYKLSKALGSDAGLYQNRSFFGAEVCESVEDHKHLFASETSFVTTCLVHPMKMRDFETVAACAELYDYKIWVGRDPRELLIENILTCYTVSPNQDRSDFRSMTVTVDRIREKEQSPERHAVVSLQGDDRMNWTVGIEHLTYANLQPWLDSLPPDWFLLKFEDIVARKFSKVARHCKVNPSKVRQGQDPDCRTRWRDWFTPEDIRVLRPLYTPMMKKFGYDIEDWELRAKPNLLPSNGARNMTNGLRKSFSRSG